MPVAGIIRLSIRQAEGRRCRIAAFCLLYLLSLAGTLLAAVGSARMARMVPIAAAGLPVSAALRGVLTRELYLLASRYLAPGGNGGGGKPSVFFAAAGEAGMAALRLAADAALLVPAWVTFRAGVRYYSLSGDRNGFLLLLAASMLLGGAGLLFALLLRCRLSCAVFLRLSGNCPGTAAAIDGSWELTRGRCADLLRLRLLTLPGGPGLRELAVMNAASALLRAHGTPKPRSVRVGLVPGARGGLEVELLPPGQ